MKKILPDKNQERLPEGNIVGSESLKNLLISEK